MRINCIRSPSLLLLRGQFNIAFLGVMTFDRFVVTEQIGTRRVAVAAWLPFQICFPSHDREISISIAKLAGSWKFHRLKFIIAKAKF